MPEQFLQRTSFHRVSIYAVLMVCTVKNHKFKSSLFILVRRTTVDCAIHLLFVLVGGTSSLGEGSALDTTGPATTVWGGEGVVDVLLRLDSHEKRGRVAELLAYSDVSLTDQHTGVVDGLGQTALEDLSLKTSLEHLLASHSQSIIQLSLGLVQQTHSDQLSEQSLTLELSGLVVLIERQQVTSGRSDLGKSVHDSPDFSLVLQTVLTDDSQLRVQTRLLERSSRSLGGLRVVAIVFSHKKRST